MPTGASLSGWTDWRHEPWGRWVLVAAILVLGSAAASLTYDFATRPGAWLNTDTGFFLFFGKEMAAGARLYVDLYDVNPPSIFMLTLAAAKIGSVVASPSLIFGLVPLILAAWGTSILIPAARDLGGTTAAILAAFAYLLFTVQPGRLTVDFAQREHLFTLLLVPELFLVASGRRIPWRFAWLFALGFAMAMKPQFLVIAVALELSARRGARDALRDLGSLVAGALAPLGLLALHSWASVVELVTRVLPLHLSGVYAQSDQSPRALLLRGSLIVLGAAFVTALLLAGCARVRLSARPLAVRGGGLLILAFAAIVHQGKYFPYHYIPLWGLASVLGAWAVGSVLESQAASGVADRNRGAARRLVLATALVVLVVGVADFHREIFSRYDPPSLRLARLLPPRSRMLFVGVFIHPLCGPFSSTARCLGPHIAHVSLPVLARITDPSARRAALESYASDLREVVDAERPEVIALSTTDVAMPDGLTEAILFTERFPVFSPGEYVPFSEAARAAVNSRGILLLRRGDVTLREEGATVDGSAGSMALRGRTAGGRRQSAASR